MELIGAVLRHGRNLHSTGPAVFRLVIGSEHAHFSDGIHVRLEVRGLVRSRVQIHNSIDGEVRACRACAVDLDLARILGRQDDQMVRELAASVERLAKAVQTARTADQAEDPVPFERSRVRWFSVDLPNLVRPSPRPEFHSWEKSNPD